MHPFRKAFSDPSAPTGKRGPKAEPALGYEFVDFTQQPLNLYATELTYCEPHWHEAAELIFVLQGSFEVLMHNRPIPLQAGGMVFVQADDLHTVHARENSSILLAVQFSPALDKIWGPRSGREPSVVIERLCPNTPQHRALITSLADLARHVFHHEPVFGDYGLLRRVFALLEMVKLASDSVPGIAGAQAQGLGTDRQVEIAKRAIGYASEHYLD